MLCTTLESQAGVKSRHLRDRAGLRSSLRSKVSGISDLSLVPHFSYLNHP